MEELWLTGNDCSIGRRTLKRARIKSGVTVATKDDGSDAIGKIKKPSI
jgi:hypothetical protein